MIGDVPDDEGDDQGGGHADPAVAARQRALELLARTEMTSQRRQQHEERLKQQRIDAVMADGQRRVEERKAAVDLEARKEAARLARTIEPPRPTRGANAPIVSKELEQVLGKMFSRMLKRHAEGEERITGTEARLASLEARLAALETRGVTQPEKTGP